MMVYPTLPSLTPSGRPPTVTVCATFQSLGVNVIDDTKAKPSVASPEDTAMVTSSVGCVPSTTVKLAVPPSSVVDSPATGVTAMEGATAAAATLRANSEVL